MKNRTLRKQRIMGIATMLVTASGIVISGDGTFALFTIPLGLALLCSKKAFIFED